MHTLYQWMPVILMTGQYLVSAYTISSPSTLRGSYQRLSMELFLALLVYTEFNIYSHVQYHMLLRCILIFSSLIRTSHFISLLGIIGVDIRDLQSHDSNMMDTSSPSSTFFSALRLVVGPRGIRTKWQIKSIRQSPLGLAPSRGRWLIRQVSMLAWQMLFLDLVYFGLWTDLSTNKRHLYPVGSEWLSADSTPDQLKARAGLVFAFVFTIFLAADVVYKIFSVCAVGCGVSRCEDWPPLFGSIRDVYSIRNFWGKVWHQLLRWPLTTIAKEIRRTIPISKPFQLQLPPSTTRLLDMLIVFVLSALLHLIIGFINGRSLQDMSGSFCFFVSSPLMIIVEETVSRLAPPSCKNKLWNRLLGACWVLAWWYVTAPWFGFPVMRAPVGKLWDGQWSFVEEFGMSTSIAVLGLGGVGLNLGLGVTL